VLDLVLRALPPLTAGPLVWKVADRVVGWEGLTQGGPDRLLANLALVGAAAGWAEGANLLAVLAWHLPTVPGGGSLASGPGVWGLRSLTGLTLVLGLLTGGSVLLGVLYLGPLAEAVRGRGLAPHSLLRRVGPDTVRFALYLALAGLAYAGLAVGAGLLAFLLGLVGPSGMALASGVFLAGIFLLGLWVWLGKGPLFLEGASPPVALARAGRVMARHFVPTVALYLLSGVLTLGLGLLWTRLARSPLGLGPAVLANALVGTGVTASLFLFYRDRSPDRNEAPSTGR